VKSPLRPAAYAAGSPSNTMSAFDGTYASPGPQTITKPNELEVARGNAQYIVQTMVLYCQLPSATVWHSSRPSITPSRDM
jgi:hypothetical protein